MASRSPAASPNVAGRQDLRFPFSDKDDCKALGGRWDPNKGKWYIPESCATPLSAFKKWLPAKRVAAAGDPYRTPNKRVKRQEPGTADGRVYLNCPFSAKDACKAAGGRWDGEAKQWYVPVGTSTKAFAPWLLDDRPRSPCINEHGCESFDCRLDNHINGSQDQGLRGYCWRFVNRGDCDYPICPYRHEYPPHMRRRQTPQQKRQQQWRSSARAAAAAEMERLEGICGVASTYDPFLEEQRGGFAEDSDENSEGSEENAGDGGSASA